VSAIPKPIHTRLAYTIKQLMHKHAVHGQQIVNLQTQMAAVPAFPASASGVSAPPAAGATYSQSQANAVAASLTALITSLTDAGIIG